MQLQDDLQRLDYFISTFSVFLIQYLAGFEPPTFGPTLSLRRRDILFYFIFPVKNNYCDIFITRTRFIVHRKPKQIVLQNNSLYVEREEEIVTDCVCACVCVCKRLVDRQRERDGVSIERKLCSHKDCWDNLRLQEQVKVRLQCDQIWRKFATLANVQLFGNCLRV